MRPDGAILLNCAARAKTFALVAVIALGVFATLLVAAGKDPLKAYADTLFYVFGNAYGFSELLVRMIPLLLTAVAAALPARIGLINVGAEGQLYMGAWLTTAGALAFSDQPAFVLLPVLTVFGFVDVYKRQAASSRWHGPANRRRAPAGATAGQAMAGAWCGKGRWWRS